MLCTPGSDDIVLNFDVVQTSDMLNLEVLEEAKTKITNSVSSETFTLTLDFSIVFSYRESKIVKEHFSFCPCLLMF